MVTTRQELGGGCVAWYPADDVRDETVLVWVAPADGGWAVYLEGLPGAPRRYEGIETHEEAEAIAEALASA